MAVNAKAGLTLSGREQAYVKALARARGETSKFGGVLKRVGGIAATYFSVRSITATIDAFRKQEQSIAKLNNALRSMGRSIPSKEIQKLASQIQTEGIFGDEALIEGAAMLSTFREISDEAMPRAMRTAADLAAQFGMSMETAAKTVGKAAIGMTGELSRYGISLSDAAKESKDFNLIMSDIESQVQGANKALGETATGGITQMTNAWGDFMEVVGEKVATIFTPAIDAIRDGIIGVTELLKDSEKFVEDFATIQKKAADLGATIANKQQQLDSLRAMGAHAAADALEREIAELVKYQSQLARISPVSLTERDPSRPTPASAVGSITVEPEDKEPVKEPEMLHVDPTAFKDRHDLKKEADEADRADKAKQAEADQRWKDSQVLSQMAHDAQMLALAEKDYKDGEKLREAERERVAEATESDRLAREEDALATYELTTLQQEELMLLYEEFGLRKSDLRAVQNEEELNALTRQMEAKKRLARQEANNEIAIQKQAIGVLRGLQLGGGKGALAIQAALAIADTYIDYNKALMASSAWAAALGAPTNPAGVAHKVAADALATKSLALSVAGIAASSVLKLNKGGTVPGGAPFTDRIPAMLTPGEGVMSREAMQEFFKTGQSGGKTEIVVSGDGIIADMVREAVDANSAIGGGRGF